MSDTQPELSPLNLGSIARGASLQLFEKALAKVAANIADKDTPATKSREIILHFKLKPDTDRRKLEITTSCEIKLAAVANHESTAYVGKSTAGDVLVFDRDPRQDLLFEPPAEKENLLQFGNTPTA
jgi:hypothetical protein